MRSPRESLCWLLGHSWWEETDPCSAKGWNCWHCPAWERDRPTSRWSWRNRPANHRAINCPRCKELSATASRAERVVVAILLVAILVAWVLTMKGVAS